MGEQAAREYGLEVVAVRLRRLNYPEEVRSAVFEQIRSERQRVAAATRAEGESQARMIRSAADRERAAVIAAAESDAARTIGEGEAQAARIANEAQAADPAFYQFLKTLETYRAALDSKTTLVLSADSSFLRLLTQGVADLADLKPANARPQPRSTRSDRGARRASRAAVPVQRSEFTGQTLVPRPVPQEGREAMSRRLSGSGLFVPLSAGYLATGVTILQPDEVGIVRRFGAVLHEPWEPGLHWGLPWGFDRVDRSRSTRPARSPSGATEPDGGTAGACCPTPPPTTF